MKNQLMIDFLPETVSFFTSGKLTRGLRTHALAQFWTKKEIMYLCLYFHLAFIMPNLCQCKKK